MLCSCGCLDVPGLVALAWGLLQAGLSRGLGFGGTGGRGGGAKFDSMSAGQAISRLVFQPLVAS